jgi:hypothetical protein
MQPLAFRTLDRFLGTSGVIKAEPRAVVLGRAAATELTRFLTLASCGFLSRLGARLPGDVLHLPVADDASASYRGLKALLRFRLWERLVRPRTVLRKQVLIPLAQVWSNLQRLG